MESRNKLQIIYPDEDGEPHPYCPHGPTLLFQAPTISEDEQTYAYYACAAHRDKSLCSYHLPAEQLTPQKLAKRYGLDDIIEQYKGHKQKLLVCTDGGGRHFCLCCNVPLVSEEQSGHTGHEIVWNLTNEMLCDPTRLLRPLDNDKAQAQYFFDDKALKFFSKCFQDLGISKVVCMGAPRLHAYLRSNSTNVQSFLLDFDYRMFYFYEDDNFAWYNMCNNHFFDHNQRLYFEKFLNCAPEQKLLVLTDPPFGCRTELIAATLRHLTRLYNKINHLPHQPLPIFWIFPYYSEHYIQQEMPQLRMCDYKVNYTNHSSYTDIGDRSRKLGSPVRVFTNVPLELLHLPVEEEYKYCALCQRYTALENRHCFKCAYCPSKNGSTYRHCDLCGCCVKPNYVHCNNCRRCTQSEEHECGMYQANQHCWICLQKGHTENRCEEWRKHCKVKSFADRFEKIITCLLCQRKGHNERNCAKRNKYLEELTFMGVAEVKFK
ncbi:PREDICTED: zinc finger CCHC domain-containing protein 4 [Rhagoletis zephyria]|uniref:zinc finger CCHC domain-containing protein 4 n=1 Tax=Rhagoletis zephyria TaxID=28612 RepID=UPI00081148CA|nr:PREDICTED: zinc finger CCHC domain-containing protein 4 [Rhagoletis zephyria]